MLQRTRKLRFIKKYVDGYLSVCKGIPGKDISVILSAYLFCYNYYGLGFR